MRLSRLQKYILLQSYFERGKKILRSRLERFYERRKVKPSKKDQINIITKSIERLIDKGLSIGYGVRTAEKWFIKEIKLTLRGRKESRKYLGEQQKLPFKS